jgi:hypothetical protein
LALRYSNKQLILASRLRALLDAETIKRKSAGQLSNLVDSYWAQVNALKGEEVLEDLFKDAVVSQLILDRIDSASRRELEWKEPGPDLTQSTHN